MCRMIFPSFLLRCDGDIADLSSVQTDEIKSHQDKCS